MATEAVAVTTPPTTAPAAPTVVSAPAAPASQPDWTSGLNEDLRGYVQNKGFKDVPMLADGYRSLEKFHGVPENRLVKVPEKADDAAGWEQVFSKLGRPATAKDYKIAMPEKGGDPEFAEMAKGMFYDAGLTQAQADKVSAKWNDYVGSIQNTQREAHNAEFVKQETALKKEWGKAFDQNASIARKACATFGIDTPTAEKIESVLGTAGIMKLFHNIGSKLGEDGLVIGNSRMGAGALTPAAAQARKNFLLSDPDYVTRYLSKKEPEYSEMIQLHKFISPEPTE